MTINYKNPEVVAQIEQEYPEMTAEYKKIMIEGYETFCAKQSNYGPGNISVGTSLITEEERKLSQTGLWFRMNDKIQRLKGFLWGRTAYHRRVILPLNLP